MMLILFHKQKATQSLDMPDVYRISFTHKKSMVRIENY